MGGNKVRKLEFLCGDAIGAGARSLVTVGAAQSNHCRLTAAAGAVLGIEVHLVLSGDRPERPAGNQLLSALFGAQLHYTGAHESHWGELMVAADALADALADDGAAPYAIPIGGSTATGALGYAAAFVELMEQCAAAGIEPAAIVHTSSSGGTHAGLVAGRALWRSLGHHAPEVLAIGVAKGVNIGTPDIVGLAGEALGAARSGGRAGRRVRRATRRPTGSATTTPCRRRPATTRCGGRPPPAVGSSTARTPARGWPDCSATRPRSVGARCRRDLRPHRRHARRVRPRRRPLIPFCLLQTARRCVWSRQVGGV